MKRIPVFLLILGVTATFIGILPFIFAYPYSDGPNSGPLNMWELITIISYEGWVWFLVIGIVLFILSIFFLFLRQKK